MKNRSIGFLMLRQLKTNRLSAAAALVIFALLMIAVFAPVISTHLPNKQNFTRVLEGPSSDHWFGTDEVGRDVFSRVVHGTRLSFIMGVLAVALGGIVGVTVGLLAGYYGGVLDSIVGRLIDVLLSFPGILLAMLIAAALGAGVQSVVVAVAIGSVPTFARLSRGAALSVREREFVEAARAAGAGEARIIVRHVLLNCFGPILVYSTLLLGGAIMTAAALSFLGVGVPPPTPEWGAMINAGRAHMRHSPHIVIFPGSAIFITVFAFNVLGDALRDIFDPKSLT